MSKLKRIIVALREIKVDKKVDLIPAETASPSKGVHYPTLNIETRFVPELEDAKLGQQVRMVIEGNLKSINEYASRDVEGEMKVETSDRTIEIHRVGISKITKALKG